ncbi:MAG: glycogen debranching protein GlgX [Candidatus Auribacterota bacterium]
MSVQLRENQLCGRSYPLGATVCENGVNFSVYSKHASAVELLFFDSADDTKPAHVWKLDPKRNKTYNYWHTFIPNISSGQIYGYRMHGPFDPAQGHRFDPTKVLIDPYGKLVAVPKNYRRQAAAEAKDNTPFAMKSIVADMSAYDWEGDTLLRKPFPTTIIYEMHVAGFTLHPSSGVSKKKRGTYAGVIEKIPYLKDLGVTAVELLPVFHFDEYDAPAGKKNYWGYAPISFFAPHAGYGSSSDPIGVLNEFRDMVKALHRAGIEVILDVVYNHTAEGNEHGPTLCYRGIENSAYYILEKNKQYYSNYTGTGNTLNANHPVVRRMIADSIRYWVQEMHVDGFRFDLASILSRDEDGMPLPNPPVLWDIETDPVLSGVKLIAEAWDAAGLYQVGNFIGDSWKEWNGRFRDDARAFMKGSPGTISIIPSRMLGSPDMYSHEEREPEQSINFITCHDGFTMNDLVSYDYKHNEKNGEDNRDGCDNNQSWNCGWEGPTDDPQIEALRNRQIKNFFWMLLFSVGTPMILMGDEVRRTQQGNNNAYCQNNEISWFDWSNLDKHADIHRFVKLLVSYRLRGKFYVKDEQITLNQYLRQIKIAWHGVNLNRPDWGKDSHALAFTTSGLKGIFSLHCMINMYWDALEFRIPPVPKKNGQSWRRIIDTSLVSPDDIVDMEHAPVVEEKSYTVQPRSIATVLFVH